MESSPFAMSLDGGLVACGDGPEVLVYLSTSGSPVWKAFADGILVGLAFDASCLLGVDSNGRLYLWGTGSGQLEQQHDFEVPARCMALASDGAMLIGCEDGLHLALPGGAVQHWSMSCPTALDWMGDVGGVGSSEGVFSLVDRAAGPTPVSNLGGGIRGVCASSRGQWGVTTTDKMTFLDRSGTQIQQGVDLPGKDLGHLAISKDGIVVAVACEGGSVWVGDTVNGEQAGEISSRRSVDGLAFGESLQLGLAHDDGDVTLVDLSSRTITQSDAHVGRARRAWHIEVHVELANVRGAKANVASAGQSLATYTGPRPEDERPSWGKWLLGMGLGCLLLVLGTVALAVISSIVLKSRGLA